MSEQDFETARKTLWPRVPEKHASYSERVRNESLDAIDRIQARMRQVEAERDYWAGDGVALQQRAEKAEAEVERLRNNAWEREAEFVRLLYVAEHLFAMVPQSVWRAHGGDDGQGHYEGDAHAEQVGEELARYRLRLSENRRKP